LIRCPRRSRPIASSAREGRALETRRIPWATWLSYPLNSWAEADRGRVHQVGPRGFTIGSNSFAFLPGTSRAPGGRGGGPARPRGAPRHGSRRDHVVRGLAHVHVVVRWTGPFVPRGLPRIPFARFAITSFAFMFVEVRSRSGRCRAGSGRRASPPSPPPRPGRSPFASFGRGAPAPGSSPRTPS